MTFPSQNHQYAWLFVLHKVIKKREGLAECGDIICNVLGFDYLQAFFSDKFCRILNRLDDQIRAVTFSTVVQCHNYVL